MRENLQAVIEACRTHTPVPVHQWRDGSILADKRRLCLYCGRSHTGGNHNA